MPARRSSHEDAKPNSIPKPTLVWCGETPHGYSLVIERDARGYWSATVASAIRSRNTSLRAAILEAAGPTATPAWAENLAAIIAERP